MVRARSSAPIRIVINGRILNEAASPFTRLASWEVLRVLTGVPEADPVLVVPEDASLPGEIELPLIRLPRPIGEWAEAAFDHWHFPREARRQRADLVLFLHASAPLSSPAPVLSVYGDGDSLPGSDRRGGRLARALALGGLRGAQAVLRSEDVPVGDYHLPWFEVPAIVPSSFSPGPTADDRQVADRLGLAQSYVLAAGETEVTLPTLLAGWTWVEGAMGDSSSLLIANLGDVPERFAVDMADQLGVGDSVRTINPGDQDWAAVLRGASALLHGGGRRNAGLLRWALASGLPVSALLTPITESVLGPAGFLVPERDSRGLGAACLTLLVEEEVANSLKERGLDRAAGYRSEKARAAWAEALTTIRNL